MNPGRSVPESEMLLLHLGRVDMQPHVQEDQLRLSLVRRQRIAANDRLPDFAKDIHDHTINR